MRGFDEQRHHPDLVCVLLINRPTRGVGTEADSMIRSNHEDGLVEDPHLFESSKQISDQAIDVLDLKEMTLIGLLS